MPEPAETPFEPSSVPVKDLRDALRALADPRAVRALQEADSRSTAQELYEGRLEELAATGADVDEAGEAQGFTVGRYLHDGEELPNYECASCPYSTLDRDRIEGHVAHEHRDH